MELFDLKVAAKRLGASVDHVRALVEDGRLRYVNIGRGSKRPRYRFTEADLNEFIEANRARGEAPCPSSRSRKVRITNSTSCSRGRRFYGSTECTSRKEAERFEAVEREKAHALVKAMARSRESLLIDDIAAQLWNDRAQYDADPEATETNLARLVEYFGKTTALTDIDHAKAKKMVAWRRGHRVSRRGKLTKEQKDALPLISNATVNRSTIAVLRRLFSFAKDEGARFDAEPK